MADKVSPFEYINSITVERDNGILSGKLPPDDYNPFIVNRGLSLYMDTVLLANEMNIRGHIPLENQYHYLHTLVSKRKRWSKWPKKMNLSKLDASLFSVLETHYKYSSDKCLEISRLLTDDQKKEVIAQYEAPQNKKKKNE